MQNCGPGSGFRRAKMTHKNIRSEEMISFAGERLFRPLWRPRISKFKFLKKKIKKM
jgi:hypothetical protein